MLTSGAAQTKAARLRSGLPGDPGVHTGERERGYIRYDLVRGRSPIG